MRRSLSPRLRLRLAACLFGAAGFGILEFAAILYLVAAVFISVSSKSFVYILFSGLACLVIALFSRGLNRCLRSRRAILCFGNWYDSAPDPEASQERRALLAGAREAFRSEDYSRSASLLSRYLAIRPQDNAARLNVASALAMKGEMKAAQEALEVAGDPFRSSRFLPSEGPFKRRHFDFLELEKSFQGLWLPLTAFLGAGGGAYLVALFVSALALNLGPYLEASSKTTFLLSLIKHAGKFGQSDFKRSETAHFVIYHHDDAFASNAARIAEEALQYNLKFYVLPDSSFDQRKIAIYICDSQKEYLYRSPAAKPWEGGYALDELQEIYVFKLGRGQDWYFENTLAHEISHVCYARILPGIEQDSWLNEGLASYLGYSFSLERLRFPVAAWLKENRFKDVALKALPFESFFSDNPQAMKSTEDIGQFYKQGFSIVYVLITYYGKDSFLGFLREYSRKREMIPALKAAYPTIQSLQDVQGVWLLFMQTPK